MNDLTLIRKNLFRKGVRTTLLIISIFIAFLLFGVLVGFNDSFNRNAEAGGADNRLITSNKINFTQPLPVSYFNQIAQTPGVADLTHASWFGGYYQDPRNQIFTFAVEPESYLRIYSDQIVLPPEQAKAFITERTGIIVGKSLADRFNWRVGQTVPMFSNIFTRAGGGSSWEFTVSGIYTGKRPEDPTSTVFIHFDYFNEGRSFGRDFLSFVTITPADPAQSDALAKRIDALFANSSYETATQDEAAFNKGFIQQLGDINFLITAVVSAGFGAILMIVGNTMVMAVRERTKEIGVLKTLGFSSPRILRMVLGESVLLALIGASLGLGLAALLFAAVGNSPQMRDFFGGIGLSPMVAGIGYLLALGLGLATGLLPALSAFNLKIIDALGRR